MKKDRFNSIFREYVKNNISPTSEDRKLVSDIYNSFNDALGRNNCIQIGSFPRYTAIKPLHDLDILYFLGNWNEKEHNPESALKEIENKIKNNYKNPTDFDIGISSQTHSITISYSSNKEEIFSVDIVPSYIYSKNEFEDDIYKVPEILEKRHGKERIKLYESYKENKSIMKWILSDPRGYIKVAKNVNDNNNDFRKTVKIIKSWQNSCKKNNDDFKLKSFHIEQVITQFFIKDELCIFDGIFKFFYEISEIISKPKIKDRANKNKFIDDYVADLTENQKRIIIEARDSFLKNLENFEEKNLVEELVNSGFFRRQKTEKFLFDYNIKTLTDDDYGFTIEGEAQERKGGFRKFILDKLGFIPIDMNVDFRIKKSPKFNVHSFKWKVKNDDSSQQPRGEITSDHTLNTPEKTSYKGNHYVECFAILSNVCVSKTKQNVCLK